MKTVVVDPTNLFVRVVDVGEDMEKGRTPGAKDRFPRRKKGEGSGTAAGVLRSHGFKYGGVDPAGPGHYKDTGTWTHPSGLQATNYGGGQVTIHHQDKDRFEADDIDQLHAHLKEHFKKSEDMEKARTPGAKDKQPRKRSGATPPEEYSHTQLSWEGHRDRDRHYMMTAAGISKEEADKYHKKNFGKLPPEHQKAIHEWNVRTHKRAED
jgi:hypothetical protein